ncbi:MAG TPA: hypothetical protein VFM51_06975 [Solirubrobacterales bacterium]|nr:hypothetical protein [Solirubrobacterales bacterium]
MKRIGPELKMPKLRGGDMKVPPFLSDLYFDLRDRRLLPLVALLLVAIVAAPILLAGGSEEPEPLTPGPAAVDTTPTSAKTLTVVKAAPGLRNYKKRLGHRSPTNPFDQRFDGARVESGQLNEVTTSSETPTSETGTNFDEPTVTSPPTGGSPGEDSDGDGVPDGLTFFTFELDVQITKIETKPNGGLEKTGPNVHRGVKAPAPLPGEKAPVVTYLGMGVETRAPLFLISTDVTAVYGEGQCVAGTDTCQLIALKPGFPVTFVYGENDVRYKINVLDVEAVPVKEG